MTRSRDAIADAYWQDAVYDPTGTLMNGVELRNMSEEDPGEPLKFKAYVDRPLHHLPPPALRLSESAPAADGTGLDDAVLSTFLYYAYGANRHDLQPGGWPYHRTVASARCFFPTELYLALPDASGRPAGLYYFDPMHHALVALRPGDYRTQLGTAAGADLDGSAAVVVLSTQLWKTAFRYRDYAYRLCCQEAGMVAGSVLSTANAVGLDGHVHFQFVDEAVNRLLGLVQPEEHAVTILPLYPRIGRSAAHGVQRAPTDDRVLAALPPLATAHVRCSEYDEAGLQVLTEVSRASALTAVEAHAHPVVPPRNGRPAPSAESTLVAPEPGDEPDEPVDLAATLRARDSGPGFLQFQRVPAPADVVWRICREVGRPYPTDIADPTDLPLADCYLVIQSVVGIEEGVYLVRPEVPGLQLVTAGPVAPLLHRITGLEGSGWAFSSVDFSSAAFVAYIAVPRRHATDRFHARGFRVLSQVAGIAAQRICVAGAVHGLTARVHNGYAAEAADECLGLAGSGDSVLFQIAVGASRPGAVLRLPLAF